MRVSTHRPTVETRNALYTTASRQAEDVRVQMRKLHQALLKKVDLDKRSPDMPTVRVPTSLCTKKLC